ncbi:hypothetical protein JCM19236_5697 [Vibrio sp. JCM 19236]|nr:hypothetical protein JCM19236_5697 [Vibrio sp. JCM 19236]
MSRDMESISIQLLVQPFPVLRMAADLQPTPITQTIHMGTTTLFRFEIKNTNSSQGSVRVLSMYVIYTISHLNDQRGISIMNKVKLALIFAGLTLGSANLAHAENFFSGITVGAGYAKGSVNIEGDSLVKPDGYSVFSRGYLVKSYKDYLFTDFRVVTESGKRQQFKLDCTSYQASLGLGYPFHLVDSISMKPYVQTGWAWNSLKGKQSGQTQKHHDNGVLLGVGLETQFGDHFVTSIGYTTSKGQNDFTYENTMFDLGYKF